MSFDVNHIPNVIQGTVQQPGWYGISAHSQYMGYLDATENHFDKTGDIKPVEKLNQSSIRYTPGGTIKTGAVSNEAIENAFGYAAADIQTFDSNGDRALDQQEVLFAFLEPSITQLSSLQRTISDPKASETDKRNAFEYRNLILWVTASKAANYMASVDISDPYTGRRDGVITVDEAAAKLLFDDGAKQLFTGNQEAYKTILKGLKDQTRYEGPTFEEIKKEIDDTVKKNPTSTFQLDGQLTAGEREIADSLTAAPIPTNQIIGQIHGSLHLRERLMPNNPFCY